MTPKGLDIASRVDDGWFDIRWRVHIGDHPTKNELIAAMRNHGVPANMGVYVADRLTAKVRRGAPSKNTPAGRKKRVVRAIRLQYAVLLRHAQLLREGKAKSTARSLAIAAVAREQKPRSLSPDTLRDILKKGRAEHWQVYPWQWPNFAAVRAAVDKSAEAQTRVDRMKGRTKKG